MRVSARALVVGLATALAFTSANVTGTPAFAPDDPALAALTQVVPEIVEEARTTPPTEIPDGDVQRPFVIAPWPPRSARPASA